MLGMDVTEFCLWITHILNSDTSTYILNSHTSTQTQTVLFSHLVVVARLHMLLMQTVNEQRSHPNPQLKPLMSSSFWPQVLLADCPGVPVLTLNAQGAFNHTGLFMCFCILSSVEWSADNCTTCVFWPILGLGFTHCENYRLDISGLCRDIYYLQALVGSGFCPVTQGIRKPVFSTCPCLQAHWAIFSF